MERDFSETKEPPLKTVSKKYYWIFISDLSYQDTVFFVPPPHWGGLDLLTNIKHSARAQ